MKTVVVIPHHLPTLDFINEWKEEFNSSNTHIIIVNDKPFSQITTWPDWMNKENSTIYTHDDIDAELGKLNSWIIPRGTSAIRSYGLWKAWQRKPDMIVTLDNDCFPDRFSPKDAQAISFVPYYISGHWRQLEIPATLDWVGSTPEGYLKEERLLPRGFPYSIRNKSKTYINHGLWSNIPDLDAAGMLLYPDLRTRVTYTSDSLIIPRYNFYPMCGMNLAFRSEVTPLMYFGLFGAVYGFDQFDDIWAGVFSKKVMDHLGWAVRSGYPSVQHRKQSNAFVNFKKQAGGMAWNEEIWQGVKEVKLTQDTPIKAYRELINKVKLPNDEYFAKMRRATNLWLDLFS